MSEREFYVPPKFSETAAQEADSRSPHVVVRQTGENLKLFFQGNSLDKAILNEYLQDFTLPYLENAKQAVPMIKSLAHEIGVDEYPTVKAFMDRAGTPTEIGRQVEAFDYTAVVFSQLPVRYRSPLFPYGFKRNGIYGAPSTISGYVRRINELQTVTQRIIDGKVHKINMPTHKTPLLRTEAFFQVGAQMPPPTDGEKGKIEIEHDTLTTLLEGIEIDL